MSMEDDIDLLPCPFCGGKAMNDTHIQRTGCPRCGTWFSWCDVVMNRGYTCVARSVEREAAAWNTRTQSAELSALRERADALAEAVEACGAYAGMDLARVAAALAAYRKGGE